MFNKLSSSSLRSPSSENTPKVITIHVPSAGNITFGFQNVNPS